MTSRVAVCIDEHPKTPVLLRAAQKKARELDLPWVAIYVETPHHYAMDEESRERILRFLALAEQMGAEIVHLTNKNVLRGVVEYMEASLHTDHPVQYIIAGRTDGHAFKHLLMPDFAQRLTGRLRKHWEVHIIPLSSSTTESRWWSLPHLSGVQMIQVLAGGVAALLSVIAAELLHWVFGLHDFTLPTYSISLLFLLSAAIVSFRFGMAAGLVATLLSLGAMLYAYIPPVQELSIHSTETYVNTVIFLLTSVIVAVVGGMSKLQLENAQRREKRTQALFQINRLTVNAQSPKEALHILHQTLTDLLEMEVAYFLPPVLNPDAIEAVYPDGIELSEESSKAVKQCWREKKSTGVASLERYHTTWRFEPMVTHNGEIGVMGVNIRRKFKLDPGFGRLIAALADHSAAIIERIELARMNEATKIRQEREKLRSMLLSSVSHDLKTPLASIIGSLSVYHSMKASLPEERLQMLTQTALDEAQRLDSFITNILDMTRLESGDVTFKREWTEPLDILLRVKKRMRSRLRDHNIHIHPLKGMVEIEIDVMMTEQVLQNILDNASKYSPGAHDIDVSMQHVGNEFSYVIRDHGPGVPIDKQEMIFDKYSRLKLEDSRVAGTGLGLAISRAIMESQGGTIDIHNHPDGGAVFTLTFPNVRRIDAQHVVNTT